MRKHVVTLSTLFALVAGSAAGVMAHDQAGPDGLVTEEAEPGVERIIRDGAGHDLDETHPTYRYDMDGIAITPDGTVWLATSYSRSDVEADPEGPLVWALGRPGTYSAEDGVPATSPVFLHVRDGRLFVIAYDIVEFEDGSFVWAFVPAGQPAGIEDKQTIHVVRSDGEHTCRSLGDDGIACQDPSGRSTSFLTGTTVNQVAAAPDGRVWAVGGYDGDNGGLYRITLGEGGTR